MHAGKHVLERGHLLRQLFASFVKAIVVHDEFLLERERKKDDS